MNNTNILSILEQLISYRSITPKGADAINYIAKFLYNLGFKCDIQSFGKGEQRTTNLYAILGNDAPNLCFAGHVDVVPPINESLWRFDPFKMNIVDDIVYGRGTVDMKGSIACALSAVNRFIQNIKKPYGSISFLLTTDEEGDGTYGVPKMLEYIKDMTPIIDFCILGEPTSEKYIGDKIKIGRRGSINFTLTIHGVAGHVAYPQKAQNPMDAAIKILNKLTNTQFDAGSEFFQESNLEITSIDTNNISCNVIPKSTIIKFNIRFNDHHTAESLNQKIIDLISTDCKDYDLKHQSSSKPFVQEYSEQMKQFTEVVQNICNTKPNITTNGGTSDARFIHHHTEVVEFGLNCDSAHKIDEHTTISDLQKLYNVYYCFLERFLSQ